MQLAQYIRIQYVDAQMVFVLRNLYTMMVISGVILAGVITGNIV